MPVVKELEQGLEQDGRETAHADSYSQTSYPHSEPPKPSSLSFEPAEKTSSLY